MPAALLALPLLAAAAAGFLLFDAVPPGWAIASAAAAILATVAAAAAQADGSSLESTLALVAGMLAAGLSLGLSGARDAYRPTDAVPLGEPVVLEGRLREDATITLAGATLTIDVERAGPPGRGPRPLPRVHGLRLAVGGAAAAAAAGAWRAGRTVRLTATLRPPATYRNFGVPDDARALARRGIVLTGNVKSAALVEVVRRGGLLDESAASARAWARRRLSASIGMRSTRSSAIATAILIGDRSGIPEEDERRLQAAGTYHVIAISGGNIAILAALLLAALRQVRLGRRAASAVAVAALLFYGRLTGAPPSVARAVAAASIYLGAGVIDHRGPALNALAVAAAIAVAVSPAAVLDPGFILSFGATLGILVGVPRLVRPPRQSAGTRARQWGRLAASSVAALFAATLCAEAALLPVGATLFARVTAAGLVLNFAAIPLMTVVQVASLGVLAAGAIPRAGEAAALLSHAAAAGLVHSARLVELLPALSLDVLPPAPWLVACYYAACLVLVSGASGADPCPAWRRRVRRVAAAVLALSIVTVLVSPPPARRGAPLPPPGGRLRVAFLDVGQGDATLAQLPGGHSLLVDAGGLPGSSVDAGERILGPALRALGARQLESLVITHADPDHIGGAATIVRRFAPRQVWEGVPVPPHGGLRELSALTSARGAAWRSVQAGDLERVREIDIRVWHPPPPDWERQRVRNDDSVVLELRRGDVSILLTGDIEREAERALVPRLALAPIVILKAPHHGSATSSSAAFIAAARPAAVVFSAGRRNPFGHPHPAVLARYRAAGVEIFRTDEDGAVVVDTDGRTAAVRTWSGRVHALSR